MTLETAFAILLSATISGSLYAMMASGLSLVWGTLGVFNFAHGSLLLLAAYVAWTVGKVGGPAVQGPLAIAVMLAAMAVFGFLLYLTTVRPLIGRPNAELAVIISTISAMIIIRNVVQFAWGPLPKQVPALGSSSITVLGTVISSHQIVVILIGPLLLLGIAAFLKFARVGLAVRSVEQNPDAALLVGVNPQFIYALVFAASAVLAAIAGYLLAGIQFLTPDFGGDPLLKAFIVIVLGGLNSLLGAFVAAYVVGLIEALAIFFFGLFWAPVILFGVIIVVLLVRPQGLLGGAR